MTAMAFLALLIAAPPSAIAPAHQVTIPHDLKARAKFPHDSPELIDKIEWVNRSINAAITYQDDQSHYGIPDLWVEFPSDGKGDCEDYAITKWGLLEAMNWPIVNRAKLVSVMVGNQGHEILAVLLPSGSVAYLDSMRDELATRHELVAAGYHFFDWRA